MKVNFKMFSSAFVSWESAHAEAAAFASTIPRQNLIGITVTGAGQYNGRSIIAVWYWA